MINLLAIGKMAKIYPQHVVGTSRNCKNIINIILLLLYFGCSWLKFDRGENLPNQALLIDLAARHAYFFGIEIWPDEMYYIAAILIIAALGLFIFTAVFGRIWCGYTCPQTVFTDLFIKIEQLIQGDRNARIRLDQAEWDSDKIYKKALTYLIWFAISFAFAFGWICYFYGAKELVADLLDCCVSPSGVSWLLGLTCSTYLFAAILRDKVCIYMCPYGRFQSAMLDSDSLVVTYHEWRGEPRGFATQNGDCVDCGRCVVVCPMGIDIRDGMQLGCIGCGLCIDACDSVMQKLNRPLGLIAYDSINTSALKKAGKYKPKTIRQFILQNFLRSRVIAYCCIMILVSGGFCYFLINKTQYSLWLEKDRAAIMTVLPDGAIRNSYNVQILNKTSKQRSFTLSIQGLEGAEIMALCNERGYSNTFDFDLQRGKIEQFTILVKAVGSISDFNRKSSEIIFMIRSDRGDIIKKSITFVWQK